MYNRIHQIKYTHVFYIYVCLFPFLTSYSNSVINYSNLALMAGYIGLESIKNRKMPKIAVLFFIWSLIITAVMNLAVPNVSSVSMNRAIVFLFYVLTIAVLPKDSDRDAFVNIYMIFAYMVLAFFIVQILLYYVFDTALMFQIPGLNLKDNLNYAYQYLSDASFYGNPFPRFPGPFSEPAIYAVYLVPMLLICLYGTERRKKNYCMAALIIITLFCSTAGMGIVMSVVSVGVCIWQINAKSRKRFIWIPFLAVICLVLLAVVYFSSSTLRNLINNLFFSGDASSSKADYRIYRGISYFLSLPLLYKITGIGLFHAEQFAFQNNLRNSYDVSGAAYEYFNGVSQIFIYTGLIGAVLFIVFLWRMFSKKNAADWGFFILYLMLIVGTSFLFTEIALIYYMVIYGISRENEMQLNSMKRKNK